MRRRRRLNSALVSCRRPGLAATVLLTVSQPSTADSGAILLSSPMGHSIGPGSVQVAVATMLPDGGIRRLPSMDQRTPLVSMQIDPEGITVFGTPDRVTALIIDGVAGRR